MLASLAILWNTPLAFATFVATWCLMESDGSKYMPSHLTELLGMIVSLFGSLMEAEMASCDVFQCMSSVFARSNAIWLCSASWKIFLASCSSRLTFFLIDGEAVVIETSSTYGST